MNNYKIKVKDEAESKSKVREYLVEDIETGKYFLTENNSNFVGAIEVPEGAEKYLSGAAFIVSGPATPFFYKKENGHDCEFYENDWHIHSRSLNERYFNNVLWSREPTQDQGLISGAEAKLAWANGKDIQFRDEFDKWYEEWTDLKDKKNGFWITDFDLPNHQFRLKPATLTVNAELPKPSNTTLHNQNYSVTYEFKTREERNAFARKLRGNNS